MSVIICLMMHILLSCIPVSDDIELLYKSSSSILHDFLFGVLEYVLASDVVVSTYIGLGTGVCSCFSVLPNPHVLRLVVVNSLVTFLGYNCFRKNHLCNVLPLCNRDSLIT